MIIKNIITSEFDLDIGATITYQYPNILPLRKDILSSYTVPSGAHSREQDWTFFSLRHPMYVSKSLLKEKDKSLDTINLSLFEGLSANVYLYNELVDKYENPQVYKLKLLKTHKDNSVVFFLEFVCEGKETIRHRVNLDLMAILHENEYGFKTLIKLYLENGRTIGFYINVEDNEKEECEKKTESLMGVLRKLYISLRASDQFNAPEILHCVNLLKTYRDKRLKRGATTFAIAFVVERPFVETVRPLMQAIINEIGFKGHLKLNKLHELKETYDKTDVKVSDEQIDAIDKIFEAKVRKYYQAVNAIFNKIPEAMKLSEELSKDLTDTNNAIVDTVRFINRFQLKQTTKSFPVSINCLPLEIELPLILSKNSVPGASLSLLYDIFGAVNLMHIYRALIMGQKILILAYECSMSLACKAVLSIPLLVNQSFNALQLCYPYCSLYSLSFSSKKSFIAGTTNPIFKVREEWDLFCDIKTREVFYHQKDANSHILENRYNKYDDLFVKYLSYFIDSLDSKDANQKEDILQVAFWDYTTLLFENVYSSNEKTKFKNNEKYLNLITQNTEQIINTFYSFIDYIVLTKDHFIDYNKERSKGIVQSDVFRCYDKIWNERFSKYKLNESHKVLSSSFVMSLEASSFNEIEVQETNSDEEVVEALANITEFIEEENIDNDTKLALLFKIFNNNRDNLEVIAVNMFHRNDEIRKASTNLMCEIRNIIQQSKRMKKCGNNILQNMSLFYAIKIK